MRKWSQTADAAATVVAWLRGQRDCPLPWHAPTATPEPATPSPPVLPRVHAHVFTRTSLDTVSTHTREARAVSRAASPHRALCLDFRHPVLSRFLPDERDNSELTPRHHRVATSCVKAGFHVSKL